jgi:UDP-N-acetylmuramate dehydrogenase
MNASCFGESIVDYLVRVDYIDRKGELCSITEFDGFKYRFSPFMDNDGIIIKGYFKVKKNIFSEEKLRKYWLCKKNNQPINYKNAGCIFKNPNPIKTWQLIKNLNLDKMHVGDACVSSQHANFLINKNNASFDDMKTLIDIIREKVRESTNINLELEIKIIKPNDFIPYPL